MGTEPLFTEEEVKRLRRLRRIVIMGAGCIGMLVAVGLISAFFLAATKTPRDKIHFPPPSASLCLDCHEGAQVVEGKRAPVMPHIPLPKCSFCHRPSAK